mgnify:CR=1 FL=1
MDFKTLECNLQQIENMKLLKQIPQICLIFLRMKFRIPLQVLRDTMIIQNLIRPMKIKTLLIMEWIMISIKILVSWPKVQQVKLTQPLKELMFRSEVMASLQQRLMKKTQIKLLGKAKIKNCKYVKLSNLQTLWSINLKTRMKICCSLRIVYRNKIKTI